MPVTPTYPGVYIEEIPSGVRTITGVATSITVFIGRAQRGPVNKATTISSFGEFERVFGTLQVDMPLAYAVRNFYSNGGSQAIIVRLFKPEQDDQGKDKESKAVVKFTEKVQLQARAEGSWGNALRAKIDQDVSDDAADRFIKYDLAKDDLFNLTIFEGGIEDRFIRESFINLSFKDGPRRIDRVLEAGSSLVRWHPALSLEDDPLPPIPSDGDVLSKLEEVLQPIEKELRELYLKLANLEADLESADPSDKAEIEGKITDVGEEIKTKKDEKTTKYGELTNLQKAIAGLDSQALDSLTYLGNEDKKEGLYALEDADLFNLLCIPPDQREGDTEASVYQTALAYCVKRRAMLIVDPKAGWGQASTIGPQQANKWLSQLGLFGVGARNAALYFPRVKQADPQRDGQLEMFAPCGIIAGVMARTDVQRGVWKAPAGIDAALSGTQDLQVSLTDAQNGTLNQRGINCLRTFPIVGRVVWGARTVRGADQLADEYKYVPIRRLALYIEESLYRGTQWVVFEPNDEPLWAQIRLNVGAFMHNLFRQSAFQGSSSRDAYFVKCDKEANPQYDIDRGIVNIHVGFAPLKPAEFVIIKIQQIAKQLEV